MLIKKTKSLCPVCNAVIEAEIFEEDGGVWMRRSCREHGPFRDLYWSDVDMYRRFDGYDNIGSGIENPQREGSEETCPAQCGLCSNHKSGTLLANIDLTNRCNLNCDFCFANTRACGYVYEPSFDQVVEMLKLISDEKPVPAPAVQFSGGEPTMREDLPAIITKAKEFGFPQVQVASNGIKLAKDLDYVQKLKDAGLSIIYLHFDGVTLDTNPNLAINEKAVANCQKVDLPIVLAPTIIKGRNDHQIGDIIRYATDHVSIIRGVNFQPIAFTGAASDDDIMRERITVPDISAAIEKQTDGVIRKSDFYPIPCVLPISELFEAYGGKPQVRFTAHQHCGAATYVFVTKDGLVPINRMIDIDKAFESVDRMAVKLKKGGALNKYRTLLGGLKELHDSVKKGEQGSAIDFWKLAGKALLLQNFDALVDFHLNALFIGTMHFMDRYNYDLCRVQRCCIHYATPDGTLIPFCTYNSGPVYREQVWQKWKKTGIRSKISVNPQSGISASPMHGEK